MRLKQSHLTIRLVLWLLVFVVLNLWVYRVFFRIDFTEDKRYTLSETTQDILSGLDLPVTVTAHFSESLPASVAMIRQDFEDLLYEYESKSDGNVVFEFINPNESDQAEQASQQAGIPPMILQVRERDKAEQMRAYMGAVVKIGEQQEVIPFVGQGAEMEYNLSRSIKKLSVSDKPRVGFVQGHGEPLLPQVQQVRQELTTLYEIDTLSLKRPGAWAEFKTLAILAPADSFSVAELEALDEFLRSGGGLVVGINRVRGDLGQGLFMDQPTGLESWLNGKGVTVTPTLITDAQSGAISVQQQTSFGILQQQISFPYMPLVAQFESHPVVQGLEAIQMFLVSPVEVAPADSAVRYGNLAYTSAMSNRQPAPVYFDVNRRWTEADFPMEGQPVAAWLEGPLAGGTEARMVVIGDGDFANPQQGALPPNNLNLLINAIDWVTDDTGLIDLRTQGVENRLLDQVSDNTRLLIKWGAFLLPILIVLALALVRTQRKKNQRIQWMQEDYS